LITLSSGHLLEVNHLTKTFTVGGLFRKRGLIAVDDVSFRISTERPVIFTLAGESGSGKTTTARLILGFLEPTSGEIMYRGKNIWAMSKEEFKSYRKEVQAIFQDPYGVFNPLLKVDGVLKTPIKKFKVANPGKEANDLISQSLEVVGLKPEEVLGKYPHQLSGGERQRIMVARAFLLRPKIIIADEPVSMLDASLRAGVLKLMLSLKENLGISFIYITHDLSTAHYISDKIIIMYLGSIVEMGSADRIVKEPLHPYVQLLTGSIPIPDPKYRWKERLELPKTELSTQLKSESCKFYDRCPERMDKCIKERPRLVDVGGDYWVACHLHR